MKHIAPAVGACLIYVACAVPIDTPPPHRMMTSSPSEDSAARAGSGGTPRIFVDAMIDPVPEAAALPTPPTIADEECAVRVPSGQTTYLYAEHQFLGKTRNELGAVQGIGHSPLSAQIGGTPTPPGYDSALSSLALIRDGAVAFYCGIAGAQTFDRVTFILPGVLK
jgi:hypothetical protein